MQVRDSEKKERKGVKCFTGVSNKYRGGKGWQEGSTVIFFRVFIFHEEVSECSGGDNKIRNLCFRQNIMME